MSTHWTSSALDINRAGQRLAALDLMFQFGAVAVEVNWFRAYESSDVPMDEWHYHSDLEVHFLSEGSVCFSFEDAMLTLRKGEAILIPAKCRHRLWNDSSQFSIRHVISFVLRTNGEDEEAQALCQAFNLEKYICTAMNEEMEALLYACLREADGQAAGYKAKIQGHLVCLIVELARAASSSASANYIVKEKIPFDKLRYRKALMCMEKHIEGRQTVTQVASHIGISAKQLQRLFLNESGRTVNQTLMDMRLKHAKMLLKDTNYSISQISQIMGFSNEQSFSRFFKRCEGQLPSRYRLAILPSDYHLTTPK